MYREGVDMSIQKEIEGKMLEIIKDGITGYLFENANVDEAIQKIIRIKKNDEFELLGRNGRDMVEKKYSWELVAKKTATIYKRLLKK